MVYQEQGMQLARDMAGFDHNEVDKLRKAISKKNDKLFAEVTDLFKKKSLERGFDERVVDSVLNLMSKFVGYAFNRSHACSYAILSFWTAWLRFYYHYEWLATCIQLAKDDEDKVKMLRQECQMEKIVIREPDINESGVDTRVNDKNEIMLPLSSIKGVGSRAEDIIKEQPYDDLKDFCIRARPNRGIVEALSRTSALNCIIEKDVSQEDFMILWDNLVLERNNAEKKKLRAEKRESKLSVSMDRIVQPKKSNTNSIGLNSNAIKNLLSDNLFD
jgi:DNA polymerase-3 subunit alpha